MRYVRSLKFNKYVDWKVYSVIKIKDKYGFRICLFLNDDSKIIQQKSGFKTIKLANEARDKVIGELYKGIYVLQDKIKTKKFLEEWLKEKKKYISYDSYVTFRNTINKYINPLIGNVYITNLKILHIKKMFNSLEGNSASTIKNVKSVLNIALDYAKGKQLIKKNPAKGFRLPKKLLLKINKVNQSDKKVLNINQINTLIKVSKGSKVYMQILFAALMGLRRGEINGLKYSDVDFVNQKLKVQRQLGIKPNTKKEDFEVKTYTKQEIAVKTPSSNRELDIPDYVFEAIIEERKKYNKNKNRRKKQFKDLGYICCSSYGRPRSKSYHFKEFKRILKENNLPNIRFHDLRKSYTTMLLTNNFDIKTISELLGHSSEEITLNTYTNKYLLIENCLEEIESFIEELLENCVERNNNINDCANVELDEIFETFIV